MSHENGQVGIALIWPDERLGKGKAMSDPTDNGQRKPLSSSSSNASGTSARSISAQPDQRPDAAQAAQDDGAPARPPADDAGASTGHDDRIEAGSEPQADHAEQESAGYAQFPARATDQYDVSTEPEAAGNFTPSYEPAADSDADYIQPVAERQFEPTPEQQVEYSQPAAVYDAAPAVENDAGYTQPARDHYSEPVAENAYSRPVADYQSAPAAENGAEYTQPEREYYSEPVAENAYTQPAAAYQSEAVAENDAVYTQAVADQHSDVTEDAVADPVDEPLIAERSETASASIDEPVYAVDTLDTASPAEEEAPRAGPLPNGSYPEAADELRATVLETVAENEARQEKTLALFDQVSRRFTALLEEAGVDAARVTFKVMEFAQANLKNNLDLAKSYAAARSVPDIFGLHADYMARQFQLLNAQAEELREMTSKFALRNAASLKPQADWSGSVKAPDNR